MESIGRLAGGVAHDFNNLLTAIKDNISLALLDMQPIAPLFEYLTSVDEATDSPARLTRQLLTFSRKQIISPKVINLNHVLTHVQRLLTRLIGEDIHLELFAAPDLAQARLDRSQAEQVLISLDSLSGYVRYSTNLSPDARSRRRSPTLARQERVCPLRLATRGR
jgi:signal transduction histidine kinase